MRNVIAKRRLGSPVRARPQPDVSWSYRSPCSWGRRWMTSSARAGTGSPARGHAASRCSARSSWRPSQHRLHRSRAPPAFHRGRPAVIRLLSAAPGSVGLIVPGPPSRPDGIDGPTLPWAGSLRLPVTGPQPTWFSPATGRSEPIGGLPADSSGYQFTRVGGGWAVQAGPGGHRPPAAFATDRRGRSGPSPTARGRHPGRDGEPGQPGGRRQRPVADQLAGRRRRAAPPRTAQEVSLAGSRWGAPVRLPGWVGDRSGNRPRAAAGTGQRAAGNDGLRAVGRGRPGGQPHIRRRGRGEPDRNRLGRDVPGVPDPGARAWRPAGRPRSACRRREPPPAARSAPAVTSSRSRSAQPA